MAKPSREPMKDKVALLMEETGCDRSEAELALQLCGYDVQSAVQAIPRLFQNIVIVKGRFCVRRESLYGLFLAILNLKERKVLRGRAVLSYNPAVYASELDQHWFDFEARLYACRLWAGTLQELSQEAEGLVSEWFDSPAARPFYDAGAVPDDSAFAPLREALARRLGGAVELAAREDVLDMGQFQEVRPRGELPAEPKKPKARSAGGPAGPLILKVALEPDPEAGMPAGELSAGDLVRVSINDSRDIAQYLARIFGARSEEGEEGDLLVPVEAIETAGGEVTIRVRFSAGVCGDVSVPAELRVRASRRGGQPSWWKRILGG